MRELLTPALAESNPRAYMAHFRRLEPEAQRSYLAALDLDQLKRHFQVLGEALSIGLLLSAAEHRLEAVVGGVRLGDATGPESVGLQQRAFEVARRLEVKAVSGLLYASLAGVEAAEAVWRPLGWLPKTVILAGDSGDEHTRPSLGWAMRGLVGELGTFYMPSESLEWDAREALEARLRALADGWGAVLDVRIG